MGNLEFLITKHIGISNANVAMCHCMKLQITVKPNARQQRIVENDDGSLTVHLTSPPVEGKANAELIKLLAKTYGVSKSRVTIKLGQASRQKLIEIEQDE